MARLLTEIISDINQVFADQFSIVNIQFFNICELAGKDEDKVMIITRDGRNITGSLANFVRTHKGFIYHRIIEEEVNTAPGKGRESIEINQTTVRLVGMVKRPDETVKAYFDGHEIANEATQLVNGNEFLNRGERCSVVDFNSNYMEIVEEELGNIDLNKKYRFEITPFTVDYKVVRKQKCTFNRQR